MLCILQTRWWTTGSRKWCLPWFALLPWGSRFHSFCLPCCSQWPPQSNHAISTSAGRHRHLHTGKKIGTFCSCAGTLPCLFPGSSHFCSGKLSPSAQQLHQLPSRSGKPFPASARPASWVAVRDTRQCSLLCCLTHNLRHP